MFNAYEVICNLNSDNYENCVNVSTKEELKEKMIKYFEEYNMFDKIICIDEDDFKDEDGNVDNLELENEENQQKREYIESLIEWKEEGQYCLVGYAWGSPSIMNTNTLLEYELDNLDFPIPLDLEFFTNTEDYILKWKKSEEYKYVYLITFVCHVGEPWFHISHVVYSNRKINDVIKTVYEEKGIFIGEFNTLGSNYIVEEVEDFDINNFTKYKFEEYEIIVLD